MAAEQKPAPAPTPKVGPLTATGGGIVALLFSLVSWYMTNKGGGFTPDKLTGLVTVLTSLLGGLGLTGGGLFALKNRVKADWDIALAAEPPKNNDGRDVTRLDCQGLSLFVSIAPAAINSELKLKLGDLLRCAATMSEVPK